MRKFVAVVLFAAVCVLASAQTTDDLWENLYWAVQDYLDSLVEIEDPMSVVITPTTRLWDLGDDLSKETAIRDALAALVAAGLIGFEDDQVVERAGTRYVWPVPGEAEQDFEASLGPNGRRVFAMEEP